MSSMLRTSLAALLWIALSLDLRASDSPDWFSPPSHNSDNSATTDACGTFFLPASAEDIAITPRSQISFAENLAVTAIGTFIASEQDYLRIRSDVSALPLPFSYIHPRALDGVSVYVALDRATFTLWHEGRPPSSPFLSCALRRYDLRQIYFFSDSPGLWLIFKGIYDTRVIAAQFRHLPGVLTTSVGYLDAATAGPTYCLTVEGDRFHYMLDDASGDCAAGCLFHDYSHYESRPGVPPALIDSWSKRGDSAPPHDFAKFMGCLTRSP